MVEEDLILDFNCLKCSKMKGFRKLTKNIGGKYPHFVPSQKIIAKNPGFQTSLQQFSDLLGESLFFLTISDFLEQVLKSPEIVCKWLWGVRLSAFVLVCAWEYVPVSVCERERESVWRFVWLFVWVYEFLSTCVSWWFAVSVWEFSLECSHMIMFWPLLNRWVSLTCEQQKKISYR